MGLKEKVWHGHLEIGLETDNVFVRQHEWSMAINVKTKLLPCGCFYVGMLICRGRQGIGRDLDLTRAVVC